MPRPIQFRKIAGRPAICRRRRHRATQENPTAPRLNHVRVKIQPASRPRGTSVDFRRLLLQNYGHHCHAVLIVRRR